MVIGEDERYIEHGLKWKKFALIFISFVLCLSKYYSLRKQPILKYYADLFVVSEAVLCKISLNLVFFLQRYYSSKCLTLFGTPGILSLSSAKLLVVSFLTLVETITFFFFTWVFLLTEEQTIFIPVPRLEYH